MAETNKLKAANHILIGLGGTGGKVLKAFKKRWYRDFPSENERRTTRPYIGFLYVDSTREMMNDERADPSWKVLGQDATFTANEFVNIRPMGGISDLIDHIDDYPNLRHLVKSAELMRNTLGRIDTAAGQKRRAGRIMFASCCPEFISKLEAKYRQMKDDVTGLAELHIHIFTGLAGGTGSGSIVDVVAQTIKAFPEAQIDVHAMIPERQIPAGFNAGRYHENGYAALRELNAMNISGPRCFRPSDVMTGAEHIVFPNEDKKAQFGLMLYSNENSNGYEVNSVKVLPELLADTLFYRTFLPDNDNTREFFRAWSCENCDDFQVEYDTRSGHELEAARTKFINTFGIKRIVYPELRIMEHISYTLSKSVIWQMRYNNFNEEDFGFVGEPRKRNYDELLEKGGFVKTWKLDERHLTLEDRIVDADEDFDDFETFWSEKTQFYNHDDACRFSPQPLDYLDGYCNEQFAHDFRRGKGVADYFTSKSMKEPLDIQAGAIIDAIEQNLFTEWANGTYSMYDLAGICDSILKHIGSQLKKIDQDIIDYNEAIESCNKTREALKAEYNAAGLVTRFVGLLGGRAKPEIYGDYQMETKDMYLGMTRKVAKDFERKLLNRLQIAFDDFNKEISEFISKLLVGQDKLEAEIVARKMENALPNLQDMVVEVREPMKIANFEHKLLTDQGKMRSLASKTRETLTGGRKFVHFRDIAQSMDENSLIEIADEHLTQMVIDWHNSDETFSRDKVIGMNVIEQLEKFFANNPQENIKTFAKKIIDQSGIFLKLNDKEIKKTKTNTEGPDIGRTIKKEFMLISMPDCEDSSKLKQFREELKTAFKESVENPDFMKFDEEGSKDNEISIVRIVSCIPMRCLDWLSVYKDKYDAMINVENEMTRRQNRILLHSEGDGSELPLLEGEGEGPKGNQLIPYLLIDAALEKSIRWGVDKREEEGWCKAVVDFLGNAELELIATKFTEIMLSEKFTVDLKNQIVDEVEKYLKNEDLTQGMRKTLVEKIMDLVKNKIVPEIGVGTTAYKEFLAATEEAVKTITKK